MAAYLEQTHGASERRVCRVLTLHRSTKRRQPGSPEQGALVARIHALSERYPRFGYRKIFALLKGEQWAVSRETVRRLRQREGLQVVKKARKRRPLCQSTTVPTRALGPNHVWSYDFVYDETTDGRRLKWLPICDEFSRELVALEVEWRLEAKDVIRILDAAVAERGGAPEFIRSDNGPEFIALAVQEWIARRGFKTLYIEPGSPWQNAYSESFNSRFRDEFLNRESFASVLEAKVLGAQHRQRHNHERPHSSLDYQTPAEFARRWRPNAVDLLAAGAGSGGTCSSTSPTP